MRFAHILHYIQFDTVCYSHSDKCFAPSPGIQQHIGHSTIQLCVSLRNVSDVVSHEQQQQ